MELDTTIRRCLGPEKATRHSTEWVNAYKLTQLQEMEEALKIDKFFVELIKYIKKHSRTDGRTVLRETSRALILRGFDTVERYNKRTLNWNNVKESTKKTIQRNALTLKRAKIQAYRQTRRRQTI